MGRLKNIIWKGIKLDFEKQVELRHLKSIGRRSEKGIK